jgi:cytochrome c-type protein NapB
MMNENNHVGSRVVMIGLAIVLLTAVVLIVGTTLQKNRQGAQFSEIQGNGSPSRPVNNEQFERTASFTTQLNNSEPPTDSRELADYYDLRAYIGAPPVVPHAVDDQSFGGNSCLQCHETGDYVPKLEAYAPIVPHPELINCNQCHVAVKTDELFMESDWQTVDTPQLGQSALLGSPPPIPHDFQLRDNCLSCHAAPAAPAEIRVSHPERENCVQCHVASETNEEWER